MARKKTTYEKGRYSLIDNKTGKRAELGAIKPTYGKPGMDISGPITVNGKLLKGGLRSVFNCEVHDPAYKSTSSCESALTYIDGEKGVLMHGGYTIEELTNKKSYIDVVHLLLNGELPDELERHVLEKELTAHMDLPEHVISVIKSFKDTDAAPMDILASAVSALSATDDDSSPNRIIGQLPAAAAMIIRMKQGKSAYIKPDISAGFTLNFMRMAFAEDDGSYKVSKAAVKAMDKLL
jgi:citrate synthase